MERDTITSRYARIMLMRGPRLGAKANFADVANHVKDDKSVVVFCKSNADANSAMRIVEEKIGGNALFNYSQKRIDYGKKGLVLFIVLTNEVERYISIETDFHCTFLQHRWEE